MREGGRKGWREEMRRGGESREGEKEEGIDDGGYFNDSLVPRPHPLTRKRVWWPLSAFLVVQSQQS